jgi:hypothetical protein
MKKTTEQEVQLKLAVPDVVACNPSEITHRTAAAWR